MTNELTFLFVTRVLLAAALGACVGLERELSDKPTGIKDVTLVSVTSCIICFISMVVATKNGIIVSDPARISAQIIPGIGFIGAGVILKDQHNIHGLTSAATIWLMAAIGMVCGYGYLLEAFLLTFTLIGALVFLRRLSRFLSKKKFDIVLLFENMDIRKELQVVEYFSKSNLILQSIYSKKNASVELKLLASEKRMLNLEKLFESCPCQISTHRINQIL